MLGHVPVFPLHMFEPLRLGQVQNQKSQQSPRVHHTYTASNITEISVTANPKTTQLPALSNPSSPQGPWWVPRLASSPPAPPPGEKNKLLPSRPEWKFFPLASSSASPHPARPGETWAPQERPSRGEVVRGGSEIYHAFNTRENQRFAETWGPWIKSLGQLNTGLVQLMKMPFCGRLTWEILIYIRGDMDWWIIHVMEHENQEGGQ